MINGLKMKKTWNEISWMFDQRGSLIDICVLETSLEDWEKLIDLLNANYHITSFGKNGDAKSQKIDKKYAIKYLIDVTGNMESKSACLLLAEGIDVNCHFFADRHIELDIYPPAFKSYEDFEVIKAFMTDLSKLLDKKVILTGENDHEIPLFEIDVNKSHCKFWTERETAERRKKLSSRK